MINAVNAKKSGLSSSASMQEIAAYITANWTGGSSNGNISYVRHYHTDSCKKQCTGTQVWTTGVNPDGNFVHRCTKCGAFGHYATDSHEWRCTEMVISCGYSDGQILSATITY